MRIGIFGGTFNPIHIGHLIIAEHLLDAADLDRIIFVPAKIPPHKSMELTQSAEFRYEMVKKAITGNPRFEVSSIELDKQTISYSVETVHALKEIYPDDQLFFIIGSDTFYELGTWYNLPGILEVVEFLVVRRPGFGQQQLQNLDQALEDFSAIHEKSISLVDAPMVQISSTLVRQKLQAGSSIRYLIPESIRGMIEARGLNAAR